MVSQLMAKPNPSDILSKLIADIPKQKSPTKFVVFAPIADTEEEPKNARNARRFDGKVVLHDGDDLVAEESVISEEIPQQHGRWKIPPYKKKKPIDGRAFTAKGSESLKHKLNMKGDMEFLPMEAPKRLHQTVTFPTNENFPRNRVPHMLRPSPSELTFGRVQNNEKRNPVLGYQPPPFPGPQDTQNFAPPPMKEIPPPQYHPPPPSFQNVPPQPSFQNAPPPPSFQNAPPQFPQSPYSQDNPGPQYFAPPPQTFHTKIAYDQPGKKYSGPPSLNTYERAAQTTLEQTKDGMHHHHHHHHHHESLEPDPVNLSDVPRSNDADRLGSVGVGFGNPPRGITLQIGGTGGGLAGLLPLGAVGLAKNIVAALLPRPQLGLNSKVFLGFEVGKGGGYTIG